MRQERSAETHDEKTASYSKNILLNIETDKPFDKCYKPAWAQLPLDELQELTDIQ